jgi:hypothetical protein
MNAAELMTLLAQYPREAEVVLHLSGIAVPLTPDRIGGHGGRVVLDGLLRVDPDANPTVEKAESR